MEGSSSIQTRIHGHAGYALVEALAGLAASAYQAVARHVEHFATAQRQAKARDELQNLSDHFLRDIGIERGDIDRMFR